MAKKALISVSNKAGVAELGKALVECGFELLSTGGTLRVLQGQGVPVQQVSDYTGYPEMLDGRVKTLHPKIHAGLLAVRENSDHQEQMQAHHVDYIDIVVANLYPFQETIAKPEVTLAEAIENIDIGGPTMLRSAAKNYRYVTVIVDPDDYERVINELREQNGATTLQTRFALAKKVFQHTAKYDTAISEYLAGLREG
jgi:phosphoribosylaminoimidazolecarboxamide formyltransferase / IMP cyclohydrolase